MYSSPFGLQVIISSLLCLYSCTVHACTETKDTIRSYRVNLCDGGWYYTYYKVRGEREKRSNFNCEVHSYDNIIISRCSVYTIIV